MRAEEVEDEVRRLYQRARACVTQYTWAHGYSSSTGTEGEGLRLNTVSKILDQSGSRPSTNSGGVSAMLVDGFTEAACISGMS